MLVINCRLKVQLNFFILFDSIKDLAESLFRLTDRNFLHILKHPDDVN